MRRSIALVACVLSVSTVHSQSTVPAQQPGGIGAVEMAAERLVVAVNKSKLIRSGAAMRRVSVANPDLVEAMSVSATDLVLNGKAPGETSLIVWTADGQQTFDVIVPPPTARLDSVRAQLEKELGTTSVTLSLEDGDVFLKGTVADVTSADRALAIASTLGKVVNLLRVTVPPAEAQILLKVRFISLDRSASTQLGANLFSTGAANTIGSISTGQFAPPAFNSTNPAGGGNFTLSDALNVFLYRRDINLGLTIKALQGKNLAQVLAEPNLLTRNGSPASFLAGGEFPFPTLQGGGSGVGQITIQFREFGIRLRFLPTITPAGNIRLVVSPEVSALDFANGLTVQGYTIPGLDVRRIQTEIELQDGQSFAIAGLLDNRMSEIIQKVPGLSSLPVLGKFFETRTSQRNNSELLVVVTPEFVNPIAAGGKIPDIAMPKEFMSTDPANATRNPEPESPININRMTTIPVEQLKATRAADSTTVSMDMHPTKTSAPEAPLKSPAPAPQQ